MRKRSRTIGLIVGLSLCTLLGAAVVAKPLMAKKAGRPPVAIAQDLQKATADFPSKSAEVMPHPPVAPKASGDAMPLPMDEPMLAPPPASPVEAAPMPAPAMTPTPMDDPEKAAEAFVGRARSEASAAVDSLTKEANQLRERLAKVEAGIARYKATLQALDPAAEPVLKQDAARDVAPPRAPASEPTLEPIPTKPAAPAEPSVLPPDPPAPAQVPVMPVDPGEVPPPAGPEKPKA